MGRMKGQITRHEWEATVLISEFSKLNTLIVCSRKNAYQLAVDFAKKIINENVRVDYWEEVIKCITRKKTEDEN